ncbi:smalltalk protein [Bacteroides thetaiotaomicron]|nr:smalltalk protein [Bacteroides thetaiotaomicron]
MKKQVWKNILQFIVTIATSIISAIGVTSVRLICNTSAWKVLKMSISRERLSCW